MLEVDEEARREEMGIEERPTRVVPWNHSMKKLGDEVKLQQVKLDQLGKDNFFGEQEILEKASRRRTNAKCLSLSVTLLTIDKKVGYTTPLTSPVPHQADLRQGRQAFPQPDLHRETAADPATSSTREAGLQGEESVQAVDQNPTDEEREADCHPLKRAVRTDLRQAEPRVVAGVDVRL